jgi:hypothetical protein
MEVLPVECAAYLVIYFGATALQKFVFPERPRVSEKGCQMLQTFLPRITRVLVLALTFLGSTSLAMADLMPGEPFHIVYTAWGDTTSNPIDFTVQVNLENAGFTNDFCLNCTTASTQTHPDPGMDIDLGGDALPFPPDSGTIEIPPDIQNYFNNESFDIQSIDFSTPVLDRYNGEIFTCGGNAFRDCGYKVTTDANGKEFLDARFSGPQVVPEPGSWLLLFTVAGAITLTRATAFAKRR